MNTASLPQIIHNFWLKFSEPEPVFYINGPSTLPPPLSRDEEEKLIAALKQGSKKAKEQLIERNLRLVVYIAKKFENTGIGIED